MRHNTSIGIISIIIMTSAEQARSSSSSSIGSINIIQYFIYSVVYRCTFDRYACTVWLYGGTCDYEPEQNWRCEIGLVVDWLVGWSRGKGAKVKQRSVDDNNDDEEKITQQFVATLEM